LGKKTANDESDDKGSYEQVRADNMERNNALLTSLGFAPMPIDPTNVKNRSLGSRRFSLF
jgi:hypothetical protein